MSVRILRWVTGCVAAVSVALLAGGIALSYAERDIGPLTRWDFSDVFEEATFVAVPVVGYVLASRRPGNRIGWITLGAGLVVGVAFFCDRYSRGGLLAASGALPGARAVDLDAVCGDLARVVQAALQPAHVSVWTSPRE